MFTVVIAEKNIIDMFDEFKIFLAPLFSKDNVAYCKWNRDGKTLEEMLPNIYDIIAFQNEWRAVIVNPDGLYQVNPFDYTMYRDGYHVTGDNVDWQKLYDRRNARFESYNKALNNPLTRLTSALCGTPVFNSVVEDRDLYSSILSDKTKLYEYMLYLQFRKMDLAEAATNLSNYKRNSLTRFAPEGEELDLLIEHIRFGRVREIVQTVSPDKIVNFIKLISDSDPFSSDPEYIECIVENTRKAELFDMLSRDFSFKDKKPSEVICVAPRTFDFANYDQNIKWRDNDEKDYSLFADFNLYPEKLRYLIFDIAPKDNKQYMFDRMRMMCFLLLLADNPLPNGVASPKRVYRVNIDFDLDSIEDTCSRYLSKLKSTSLLIRENLAELRKDSEGELDNSTSQKLFESDITIPIYLNDTNKGDLFATYHDLGLAADCPQDETAFWNDQYRSISKKFVRYLREPRRSLQNAVTGEFRQYDTVEDDRALQMTPNQLEDVVYRLQEEEQNMVNTSTTQLYNIKKFKDEMEEADEEIRRGLETRMPKKRTVIAGLIAILAYLFGFTPLLIGNANTVKSFLFSLGITGIAIGVFAIVGIVCLIVLRKRLVNRFKHFNYVMTGITDNIESGLRNFSDYLSHACNVMRQFSVLRITESAVSKKQKILHYHLAKIQEKTKEVYEMFSKYIDCENISTSETEPYDFDFTLLRNYDFKMPYALSKADIDFLQPGNRISIPVDYVASVSLTREELYD